MERTRSGERSGTGGWGPGCVHLKYLLSFFTAMYRTPGHTQNTHTHRHAHARAAGRRKRPTGRTARSPAVRVRGGNSLATMTATQRGTRGLLKQPHPVSSDCACSSSKARVSSADSELYVRDLPGGDNDRQRGRRHRHVQPQAEVHVYTQAGDRGNQVKEANGREKGR